MRYCAFSVGALSVSAECPLVALGLSMFVAVDLSDVLVSVPSRLRIFWPTPLSLLYVFPGSLLLILAISLLPQVSLRPPLWLHPSAFQREVHNVWGRVDIVRKFGCRRWIVLGLQTLIMIPCGA